jgi:hypothetical protein
MGSSSDPLPYWLVNVPRDKWPSECPEYLLNLSEKDEKHLAVRDEDYHFLTWEEVKKNVGGYMMYTHALTHSNMLLNCTFLCSIHLLYYLLLPFLRPTFPLYRIHLHPSSHSLPSPSLLSPYP